MVNLDELKKKYEEITSRTGQKNQEFLSKFLITKEGTTVVRILPPKDEDDNFYAVTTWTQLTELMGQ